MGPVQALLTTVIPCRGAVINASDHQKWSLLHKKKKIQHNGKSHCH